MTRIRGARAWLIGPVALAAAAAAVAEVAAGPPDLSGRWRLDRELTERLRESDRSSGERERIGRGGERRPQDGDEGDGEDRGGDIPGGPVPGGWRGESGEGDGRPRFAALNELTIVQDGARLTITDGEGRVRVLSTDGAKRRDEERPNRSVTRRARWEADGTLTVETESDRGPKRTESFLVSNDRKHLYVTTTSGRGSGRSLRLAYYAMTEEELSAPAKP